MSGEATALEHLPSKVLWYILLGHKDLGDCTVALPWRRSPPTFGLFMRRLLRPGDSKEGAAQWSAQVIHIGPLYKVYVEVPNRNQHSKSGFHSVEEAMAYADGVLTQYGVPLLGEQT